MIELQVIGVGIVLIVLGFIHAIFPKQFNWKQELASLSMINREMMYIHTFFIAFALVLVGMLCLTSSVELVNTPLGKRVSLGLGIFWFVRLYVQFFGYSAATWKGKPFETSVHIVFTGFWAYLSGLFMVIYWR